ncbi:Sortase family protein [Alloactinosynnema sp. L-07]|uniref:sortase n=1 Tax=Alloactinosynnema sp. L-07 TaxID=1653480 RepID=UPI00065EFF88|nr:sortase [Alloactinosynnema sp. L-07]CRK62103.1 Sortase family protein [Alloactinosynnema sp. L-07]
MTVTDETVRPAEPAPAPVDDRRVSWLVFAGQMFAILGAVLLCFVAQLALIGAAKHARDQERALVDFRVELANATAPVSALTDEGRLLDAGTSVAIIEIPRLRLREVVAEGTSARTLKSGPGHLRNTPLPGQAGISVILGRRAAYGGPFSLLDRLQQGDQIIVTTGQGEHRYMVQGVRHAGDKERPAPKANEGRLLLATADGPMFLPTDVMRVDARLTSEVQTTSGAVPAFAVPDSERLMVGDNSALVPVVLWSLLLAVAAVLIVWVRKRVGRWHAWVIGLPVLGVLGVTLADQAAAMLPNLL